MSITAIIMAIIGVVGAAIGALIMRPIAKSSGEQEGMKKQTESQRAEQEKAAIQSIKDRVNVDKTVGADSDAELDERLSKYDRKG